MFKPIILSAALGVTSPRLAPIAPSLALPRVAPVLPAPGLAAPSLAAPRLASPALPNAVAPAAPAADPGLGRLQRLQSLQYALLEAAEARTGLDITTLSMGMSLVGNGISLGDLDAMLSALDELGAGEAEAAAALSTEFERGNLKDAVVDGKLTRDGLSMLAAVTRDIASAVEIRRNNRFLDWYWGFERGRAKGSFSSENPSVRALSGGRWLVLFGTLDGEPLGVTLATLGGRRPDASKWVQGIERSPLFGAELTDLRALLAQAGLLGP